MWRSYVKHTIGSFRQKQKSADGTYGCRTLICILTFIYISFFSGATNIVTYSIRPDSSDNASQNLSLTFRSISNANDRTRISFDLINSNVPFTIYKANWINCGSVRKPLEPFSLIAYNDEVAGKITEWHICIDFPFSCMFDENDVLILSTDRGDIHCPTSRIGEMKENIDILQKNYEQQIDSSERSATSAWIITGIVFFCMIMAGTIIFIVVRQKFIIHKKTVDKLSSLIDEQKERNYELEAKVESLYGTRLDTINMLCNEYFEKHNSEKMKLSLYNEIEKHILDLRNSKKFTELESSVNFYLNDILIKAKEQIPELSRNDLMFLTYLFAGFAPKAVCIFTDIKIKNFYNRRSRLKERILASDAPEKEYFVSKMGF